jgi:hypothetical protein
MDIGEIERVREYEPIEAPAEEIPLEPTPEVENEEVMV